MFSDKMPGLKGPGARPPVNHYKVTITKAEPLRRIRGGNGSRGDTGREIVGGNAKSGKCFPR